nr:exodeoxyribonuclease V subunit gamma [Deltaproteobacteria bacterium]
MTTAVSGLMLFTSNRLEILIEKLAEALECPLSSPFVPEVIVVQSKGMERWISMQLGLHHGVCANYRFPFPNAIIRELFEAAIPCPPEPSRYDPDILTWRLMGLLPRCLQESGFEPVRQYLGNRDETLKCYQLAEQLSRLFDQYLVFRPEMIRDWEAGSKDDWQAELWRRLSIAEAEPHRAQLREVFLQNSDLLSRPRKLLPERISVFGISALPKFHLEILNRASSFLPVYLFLLNPCRQYWSDIRSLREERQVQAHYGIDQEQEDLHLERGNSLLASLGKMGREFFELVYDMDFQEHDFSEDIPETTLLGCIQHDITVLEDRSQNHGPKTALDPSDYSVQIHSCHSPMREVEVLYNRLLDLFEKDPTLKPEDILVMTPDIEQYIPFLQAVFETPCSEQLRIPYTVTDRTLRRASSIAQSLFAILGLHGGRFNASEILGILEVEAVHASFGLTEAETDMIKHWVDQTGIRWGIDERTRQECGLTPYSENTWKHGLQRLLLGYTLPGHDEHLFRGILPYDHIEGEDTVVLGKFFDFVEQLFAYAVRLGEPRSIGAWAELLNEILSRFFVPPPHQEREVLTLRLILNGLGEKQALAAYDDPVNIDVILSYLRRQCQYEAIGSGFMSGGVTFGTLLPMRSIPFSVICLLGLNNDAYPRRSIPFSFDRIAQKPQPGDRSRSSDDRYLFLEALISSRKCFYISYVGQSIQDNSVIPPSVVVSELLDYIDSGFALPGGSVLDQVMTRHSLQAFSPQYFRQEEKFFSYSEEDCLAAKQSAGDRTLSPAFIDGPLTPPPEEWKEVTIESLCRFFSHPVRTFLSQRLGLYLDEAPRLLQDREPFEIAGLERYLLEEDLLEKLLSGVDLKQHGQVVRASGTLPPGTVGDYYYEMTVARVSQFAEVITSYCQGPGLTAAPIDLTIGEFTVRGMIRRVYPRGLIGYRCSRVRPQDRLGVWIQHLALNSRDDCEQITSYCIGWDDASGVMVCEYQSPPPEQCRILLRTLLERYWSGLTVPLRFFPRSSWKYAEAMVRRTGSEQEARTKALAEWRNDYGRPGEEKDLSYQRCFREPDPLNDEFRKIALEIFAPLLEYETERNEAPLR